MKSENTVRIKMTADSKGSDDGIHVTDFVAGQEYVVGKSLAGAFVHLKVAEIVDVVENKAVTPPENKGKPDGKGKGKPDGKAD